MALLLGATAAAALLGFWWVFRFWRRGDEGRKAKKKYHPIAGTVFHMWWYFDSVYDYVTELCSRHRTFRVFIPLGRLIYTADPANVEYMLKTNFSNYGKGSFNYELLSDLLGDGIFAVDGDKWRQQRKLASSEFSTRVLRDFSGVIFKNNAVKLARKVSEAASASKIIDVQDLFMKTTMDSIFKVAFNVELNSLVGLDEQGVKFAKAFDESSRLISRRFANIFWKIMRFLNIGSERLLKENIKIVDDFVYKLILTKASNHNSEQNYDLKKEDILSRFLVQSEKDPQNMNHKYLRDIMLSFVIAGKDTTAGTLSWFFYMLCRYPSVQEKIVQEVKEATSSKGSASVDEFAANITDETLDKLQYLHAALSETLRLYPAVPLDAKVCFLDDTLPDGFSLRKGDVIDYAPYAMGRMKFLWGEDAEVFRPERWLDENGVFCPESPFKFTAFQAGPRICLGREFAYRQMKIFSAVLLRFFAFKLGDESKVVNYRIMLTLHIDEGVHLHAYYR